MSQVIQHDMVVGDSNHVVIGDDAVVWLVIHMRFIFDESSNFRFEIYYIIIRKIYDMILKMEFRFIIL